MLREVCRIPLRNRGAQRYARAIGDKVAIADNRAVPTCGILLAALNSMACRARMSSAVLYTVAYY